MKNNKILIALFLASPFIVFFDILLLNHTIVFSDVAADASSRFGGLLPVADPAAGSFQDHPWLFKVASALRSGSIPLVNLDNGLGSPLLESMQSGVLYPLNFVLIFLNLSTSNFFDLFSVLHVLVLAINAFMLFSLYAEQRIALVCATALALSPLTFIHLNMVHYRAFVWTPLIAWASLSIARERYSFAVFITLIISIFCSITAGNPQETFFGLLASCMLFLLEIIRLRAIQPKSILIFITLLIAGISLSSPALLPYLISQSQGLMSSVGADVSRSSALIHVPWLLNMVVPYANGAYPDFYRLPQPHHDEMAIGFIHPIFIVLLIAGLLIVFYKNRIIPNSERFFFISCLLVALLAIISISELSPFVGLVAQIPFVKTIRLAKYTNYIYLLLAFCSCISLRWLLILPIKIKRYILNYSSLLFIIFVSLILALQIADQSWNFHFKHIEALVIIWLGFIITSSIFIRLLRSSSYFNFNLCIAALIIGAILMRPYGFPEEHASYTFFHPLYVSQAKLSSERILATDPANTNILKSYESISLFDPINNAALASLITTNFQTLNPYFWIQPTTDTVLNDQQADLLRLMGVTLISGYQLQNSPYIDIADDLIKLDNSLPRIFLIRSEILVELQNACTAQDYSQALQLINASLLARPLIYEKEVNRIRFTLDTSAQGLLVALQAFTPAWQFNHVSASSLCSSFSSWSGSFQKGKMYEISYMPLGLRKSLYGVILGGLLLAIACGLKVYLLPDTSRKENFLLR